MSTSLPPIPPRPRVAIHQPSYLPYGGFFAKAQASDVLIVLDTVLYSRSGFQSRNRIRTARDVQWLSVPVYAKSRLPLSELGIVQEQEWAVSHWRALQSAYGAKAISSLAWLPELGGDRFSDVAWASLEHLLNMLGLSHVRLLRASEIGRQLGPDEPADDRLIRLLHEVDAGCYVAGQGGREYMDSETWRQAGIPVELCRWTPTPYRQPPHDDFVGNLSVVDMIGRVGPERTAEMIVGGTVLEAWADIRELAAAAV